MINEVYRSNAKIILSGEYAVLFGARALALPLNRYQQMEIELIHDSSNLLFWKAIDINGLWFEALINVPELNILSCSDYSKALFLLQCLSKAKELNNKFLTDNYSRKVTNFCNFNIHWGLGSSSTLITNIAQWAQVDPFILHQKVSKGSGYDIACALTNKPIIYSLQNRKPHIETTTFYPPFLLQLNLVYSGKKQNTSDALQNLKQPSSDLISAIDEITFRMLQTNHIAEFMQLISKHEQIIASIINQPRIKDIYFSDFDGEIKSLGAWGGDLMLVASTNNWQYVYNYFKKKGFKELFSLSIFLFD